MLYVHWYAVVKTTRNYRLRPSHFISTGMLVWSEQESWCGQYRNAGVVKCVVCMCYGLHCSKSPTCRTSLQWKRTDDALENAFIWALLLWCFCLLAESYETI